MEISNANDHRGTHHCNCDCNADGAAEMRRKRRIRLCLLAFLLCAAFAGRGQEPITIVGQVTDRAGLPLPGATVIPQDFTRGAVLTDEEGRYALSLPGKLRWVVRYSFVGYKTEEQIFNDLEWGETRTANIRLTAGVALSTSEVVADGERTAPIQRIDPKIASRIPSPRGTIEDALMQAPVNFTSELSSAYNVRGGSFDENLVYVNDIEVYRPFLVRAGQQEGLSFPNPDMVESIDFSAGGFEARYGDKMSSVLDIQYRKPREAATRMTASMLGLNLQQDAVAGAWTFNTGFRYRDNAYVLGSLDEGGEYQPRYIDLQSFVTWDPDGYGPWELEWLGMFGANDYRFTPQTRQTEVGNINEALRLTIYFDGAEDTRFRTGFGSMAINRTTETTRWRLITSMFRTSEQESFDILGAYYLDELDRDLGSDDLGEALVNRGVGAFLNHARNALDAEVLSLALKGTASLGGDQIHLAWGLKAQQERIDDRLSEWEYVDSAGYSTPHPLDSVGYPTADDRPAQTIELNDVVRAENSIASRRAQGFLQSTWSRETRTGAAWKANVGLRGHWWSFNNELVGGPRGHISYTPAGADTAQTSTVFKLSGGLYWQPPFYREMRGLDGQVNPDIRAQRAVHAVLGMDRQLEMRGRPFKLVTELYYKDLASLIPYEVENVRQRYYATNNASGYATGVDFMLNGEFIEGIQSWLRMSVMSTAEDLEDDSYYNFFNDEGALIVPGFTLNDSPVDSALVEPGFIPRPTDQRFNLSLLFQDEMPGNDAYKVLLSLYFGTGLPYGPPSFERYLDVLRTPLYRRVDIGFSRDLFTKQPEANATRSGFVALEIFNLLGIRNTINHTWIEDVNGRMYAIPNYLTNRRINVKVGLSF